VTEQSYTIRRRPGWGQDLVVSGAANARSAAENSKASLRGANLREANLYGADLYGASLGGADLRGADLREANLYGADLYGASLGGADLRGANLREANLYGADLYGASLGGANLREADLYGADLYGASLGGADLRGADLSGANLREADLYGADLSEDQLRAFRADMWVTLTEARDPNEIRFLIAALKAGAVDGQSYGDGKSCACLVGTLARFRREGGEDRDHGSNRPAERWFMMIRVGDIPGRVGDDGKETGGGFAARKALEWAEAWCEATGLDPEFPPQVLEMVPPVLGEAA
jgi:hypothetical protein